MTSYLAWSFIPRLHSGEEHARQKTADQYHAQGKLIERGIPEFGPIVTVNDFQVVGMLIIQPQG
jgi:hypothetical protein